MHCGKDPFKLYCDAIALLRSYSLSVGDWFSHGLPPVLVSGNIPVRNSRLFMTLLSNTQVSSVFPSVF